MNIADVLPLSVDPVSLAVGSDRYENVANLYRRHATGLLSFCGEMQEQRCRMLARGFSVDFGDAEAELLYLLIRDQRPSVVVEISPCCGYSTNYILAALTHNGHGRLISYEIEEQINGTPIAEVIHGNLAPSVDAQRLELLVGDATKARISDHDFLFLDSNHEAWFAGWYLEQLVNRPRTVFVHDIAVRSSGARGVMPKAPLMGVREQYYLLQSLHENHQRFFSVADFAQSVGVEPRASIPPRNGSGCPDRSVVFPGHTQSKRASAMHRAMTAIQDARIRTVVGDRNGALRVFDEFARADVPLFVRSLAMSLLPLLGYRCPTHPEVFRGLGIDRGHPLSLSEAVALLEFSVSAFHAGCFSDALQALPSSRIDPVVRDALARAYGALRSAMKCR